MKSTILFSIDQLAVRARRLVMVHAIALTLLSVLGAATLLAIADYLVHFQDHGIRWLQFTALLLVSVAACLHFLRPALHCRFEPVLTARRVERQFPQLGQRLSSTVAFLLEDKGQQLSAFQQALHDQVELELARLNMESCLVPARTRQAVLGFFLLVAMVLGCISWQTSDSLLAAGRLVQPWRETSWPRRHQLRLEAPPLRTARGDPFQVTLVDDRGRLPGRVIFEVVYDGDEETGRFESTARGSSFEFHLERVARSFRLRAHGGDDDTMPWHHVDVVEPPALVAAQLTLHSPAYTARASEKLSGDGRLIAGSQLEVEVEVDRPVDRVELVFENGREQFRQFLQPGREGIQFALDAGNSGPWIINESGHYWFELSGEVAARTRSWRLEVISDEPPTAMIENPRDGQAFWTRAIVPVVADVRDDIRIRDIQLQFRLHQEVPGPDQSLIIVQGPLLSTAVETSSFEEFFSGDHRRILFAWDLGRQQGLGAGSVIEFELVVTDYLGNTASSRTRQLRLLDREDLIEQLVRDHLQVSDSLGELSGRQKLLGEQTHRLRLQSPADRPAKEVAGELQQLLLQQQQVIEKLVASPGGLLPLARELERAIVANHLHGSDIAGQVDNLEKSLSYLADNMLPPLKQYLAASWKLVDASSPGPLLEKSEWEQAAALLEAAELLQQGVAQELEKLSGSNTQGNRYRMVLVQFEQLLADQDQLLGQTRQRQLERLTRVDNGSNVVPEDAAGLLLDRQQQLAEQFDRLQGQLRLLLLDERTGASHREAASQAQQHARRAALGGLQLAVVQSLRDQQLGKGVDQMVSISSILGEIVDILSNRHARKLQVRAEQIAGLLEGLARIKEQQQTLVEDLRAAREEEDLQARTARLPVLADRQDEVAGEIASLLEDASETLVNDQLALARLAAGRASMACREGHLDEATGLAEEVTLALQRGLGLLDQLEKTTRNQLAFRMVDQLDPKLQAIREQQQRVLEKTQQLNQVRQQRPAGTLLRSEQITVSGLAALEQQLADKLAELAGALDDVSAVRFALEEVGRMMQQVGGLLEAEQVGEDCQQLQQELLERLDQVCLALAEALASSLPDSSAGMKAGGSTETDALLQSPAELQLLLSMQQQILEETRMLERIRQRQGSLPPRQQQQHRELVSRQQQLASLVARIRNPAPVARQEGGQP